MNLRAELQRVINQLETNPPSVEAEVLDFVIEPILRSLGWDTTDKNSYRPQYQVGGGRVDIALVHENKPYVFIEAKKRGGLDAKGEQQLFNYASDKDLPFLVLTDGEDWNFYLIYDEGKPQRFNDFKLSVGDDPYEYEDFLEDFLKKENVVSKDAVSRAKRTLREHQERKEDEQTILSTESNDYVPFGEYGPLILNILEEKGGKGTSREVVEQVEQRLRGRFRRGDREIMSGMLRWVKNTHGARSVLVKSKQLKSGSPSGIWEISNRGRKSISRSKTKPHRSKPPSPQKGISDEKRKQKSYIPFGEYEITILKALDKLGGSASSRDVVNLVEEMMRDRFQDADFEPGEGGMPRWKKMTHGSRTTLVKNKFMKPSSLRGIWEISARGKRRARS